MGRNCARSGGWCLKDDCAYLQIFHENKNGIPMNNLIENAKQSENKETEIIQKDKQYLYCEVCTNKCKTER